jgi:hypothetical protein
MSVKRTEPFVTESMKEFFDEVTSCIASGLYYFKSLMSWENTEAFDLKTLEEIEQAKWRFRSAGFDPEVRYLRYARWCLVFSDESSFMRGERTGDIREESVSFCGYEVSSRRLGPARYTGRFAYGDDYLAHRKGKAELRARSESVSEVANNIRALLEVPTPEVHKQVEQVLDAVNRVRRTAGLELVSREQVGLGAGVILTIAPG